MKLAAASIAAACALAIPTSAFAADPSGFQHVAPPYKFDDTLPELKTPAVISIDASWLRSLPANEWTDIKNIPRFHCDGAVIHRIAIINYGPSGKNVRMDLHFYVGLRKGGDRDITIDYGLFDGELVVGSGHIKTQNLDERNTTMLEASIVCSKSAFDRLKRGTGKPILRITMSIEDEP